jgi:branched-chain amino acid transport system permease protein
VLRSRYGLALSAIRDSEATGESAGVDSFRTKLGVYVLVAAATGTIGICRRRISPEAAFSVLDWNVMFIVIIGGFGTIEGPTIGVIVFYAMQHYLADFGTWYLILLGALAIATMLFAPKGIWGYVAQRDRAALFPVRRMLASEMKFDRVPRGRCAANSE